MLKSHSKPRPSLAQLPHGAFPNFDLISKASFLSDLTGFDPNPQNLSTACFSPHGLHVHLPSLSHFTIYDMASKLSEVYKLPLKN